MYVSKYVPNNSVSSKMKKRRLIKFNETISRVVFFDSTLTIIHLACVETPREVTRKKTNDMTALSRNKYPSVEAENKLGHIFAFRHYHMDLPKNRTINGTWISINIVGNFRRLAMLFSILSRSHGDIYSFHTNPLLDDSVSTRCSPITCRSTLQAAAECYNTSTCLAISHKGNKGKYACPARVRLMAQN